jgi:hypothetical protein
MKGLIIVTAIILFTTSCYRDNWRAQYSGNEQREVSPAMLKILQDEYKQEIPKSDNPVKQSKE